MGFLETLKSMRAKQSQKPARFELRYVPSARETVVVGHLDFDGSLWSFRYSDEYKARADLRPIEGFDDKERVYSSPYLFPFFAVRIPALDRRDVQEKLGRFRLREPDPAELLRIFGRRVVSSPAFELVPAA